MPVEQLNNEVDIDAIRPFGCELWCKPQLHFDHATFDVRAYVLLADDPARKLCFNTYNGKLGRDKDLSDLHLEDFKDAKQATGKKAWYLLRDPLDTVRKSLEKSGYRRV